MTTNKLLAGITALLDSLPRCRTPDCNRPATAHIPGVGECCDDCRPTLALYDEPYAPALRDLEDLLEDLAEVAAKESPTITEAEASTVQEALRPDCDFCGELSVYSFIDHKLGVVEQMCDAHARDVTALEREVVEAAMEYHYAREARRAHSMRDEEAIRLARACSIAEFALAKKARELAADRKAHGG